MSNANSGIGTDVIQAQPAIRVLSPADLKDVLAKGWDDFVAMPTFAIFLVVVYPIIGVVLFSATFGYDMLPMAFPLIAGFALIGPVAAVGLYELSRCREQGLDISLGYMHFFRSYAIANILTLGAVLLVIFVVWLATARAIYASIFDGLDPRSVSEFLELVFTSSRGWTLIVVGCGVGFLFALAAFMISVVSFPMMLDRNASAFTAALTSIRVVLANPRTMALWGLIVAGALVIGSLPCFVALIVVLPVLGHSTWHLYRAAVE
jgi:uncharacterized membrane protein